jgi:O-antigen ligase
MNSALDPFVHVGWAVLIVVFAFGLIGLCLVSAWFAAAVLGARSARLKYHPEVLD